MVLPLLHFTGGFDPLGLQPDVIFLCIVLGGGYYYTVTELRTRWSDAGRVKRSQVLCFAAGVLVIFGVSGSPMHDLADRYLVAAHMFQHVMLTLVAAPLLLVGIPGWVWQHLIRSPRVLAGARFLTNGVVALVVFNTVLVLTHLPESVDLQTRSGLFHLFAHTLLVGAGVLMWWPILSQVPELPRLSYPLQMGYLFMQSLIPSVMASFVTFANDVVYTSYAHAPRILGITPIEDQQIGGGIMKVLGSLIIWSFIAIAFFRWYAKEQAEEAGPRWREVEEELRGLGLTRRQ